jgi:hypothetical protein
MKYKDFNKIIKEYERMASKSRLDGNEAAAKSCEIIIEDLKYLFKSGFSKRLDIAWVETKKMNLVVADKRE